MHGPLNVKFKKGGKCIGQMKSLSGWKNSIQCGRICVCVCVFVCIPGAHRLWSFVSVKKQTASTHSRLLEAEHAMKYVWLEIPQ